MSLLAERIRDGLREIPIYDVHSHICAGHPQAQSIADILFYHFVRRELYSAGLPDDTILVSEAPLPERMSAFFQHYPFIEHTTTGWCLRAILEKLYRVPGGELTPSNWSLLQQAIEAGRKDPGRPIEVLEACGVESSLICESRWSQSDLKRHPFLNPMFEDLDRLSFDPTRKTTLIDLVCEADEMIPRNPSELRYRVSLFFREKKGQGIRFFTAFISSAFAFEKVDDQAVEHVLARILAGIPLSSEENNRLVNWLLDVYLDTLQELVIPAQFVIGAYWARPDMRYGESYVWTNHRLILDLRQVCARFPRLKFSFMCASFPLSQELTILARMLPNVSLLGFWWHTLNPVFIERVMEERLEALPANKWIAVATDAYCVEWAYGKVKLVLECLVRVLTRHIEQGRLTEEKALWIAQRLLHDNPREIYP